MPDIHKASPRLISNLSFLGGGGRPGALLTRAYSQATSRYKCDRSVPFSVSYLLSSGKSVQDSSMMMNNQFFFKKSSKLTKNFRVNKFTHQRRNPVGLTSIYYH